MGLPQCCGLVISLRIETMRCWLSILVCWLGWSGLLWGHVGSLLSRTNNGLAQGFSASSGHLNYVTGAGRSGALTVAEMVGTGAASVTVNGQTAALDNDQTFALGGFDLTSETNTFAATATDGGTNSASATVPRTPRSAFSSNAASAASKLSSHHERESIYRCILVCSQRICERMCNPYTHISLFNRE
jgi:hypothetical protein